MVTLEQVRQLETKIGKAIDYVNRVSSENARLRGELDGSEKRAAELEDTVQRFREEQGRIEEGILAALERLDQFEDAINKGLSNVQAVVAAAAPAAPAHADQAAPGHGDSGRAKAPKAPVADASPDDEPAGEDLSDETLADEEPPPNSGGTEAGEYDLF
jgi:septal ring factor EnvC (AmiA/AmiB activator)